MTNTSSTKVERMLGKCVEWSVQTAWTPFNIFADSKEKCCTLNNVERPVQTPPTFGSTKCRMHGEANVETVCLGRALIIENNK